MWNSQLLLLLEKYHSFVVRYCRHLADRNVCVCVCVFCTSAGNNHQWIHRIQPYFWWAKICVWLWLCVHKALISSLSLDLHIGPGVGRAVVTKFVFVVHLLPYDHHQLINNVSEKRHGTNPRSVCLSVWCVFDEWWIVYIIRWKLFFRQFTRHTPTVC